MVKSFLKKYKNIIVFLIYIAVVIFISFFHENWRDEAQAWLIAKECNIFELIKVLTYEGHFIVWYLILMPFAKLGFPYYTMNIISMVITAIAVLLILKKSPFKFYTKVLLIFSFPLIYLYPIISRSYCLIPLAIVLLSIFYKDRKQKPLRFLLSLVLLENTHVIMLGMVGVVFLSYIYEFFKDKKENTTDKEIQKKQLICLIICAILMLLSILPLFASLGTNKDVGNFDDFCFDIELLVDSLLNCIYRIFIGCYITVIMIPIYIILIFIFVTDFLENKVTTFKFLLCILWQLLIYVCIYATSSQRAATMIFIYLYFVWTKQFENKMKNKDLVIIKKLCYIYILIFIFMSGVIWTINFEIKQAYSNANKVGSYINENVPNNSIITCRARVEFISAIIPYVSDDIEFYQLTTNRYFRYTIWNEENQQLLVEEDISKLLDFKDKNKKVYYIYCKYWDGFNGLKYEKNIVKKYETNGIFCKLFEIDDVSLIYEDYILYEVDLEKLAEQVGT